MDLKIVEKIELSTDDKEFLAERKRLENMVLAKRKEGETAIEKRLCGDCRRSERIKGVFSGWMCSKFLIRILRTTKIQYNVSEGTCWESRQEA